MIAWPIAVLAALFLAVFVFIVVQVAVDGWVVTWDLQVTQDIVAARSAVWNRVFWLFTLLGNTPVVAMATVVVTGVLSLWGRRARAVLAVAAVAVATAVSELLKNVLQRPRPSEVFALIETPSSYSLPSGHALVTGVFVGVLVFLALRWGSVAGRVVAGIAGVGVAGIIGFSRIYLGVHWTSDVIGGWCLAGICLIVLFGAFYVWERSSRALADTRPVRSIRFRAAGAVILALALVVVFILTALSDPLLA